MPHKPLALASHCCIVLVFFVQVTLNMKKKVPSIFYYPQKMDGLIQLGQQKWRYCFLIYYTENTFYMHMEICLYTTHIT